ncbi:MAG: hypothetical protein ACJA1A_003387 [Saprospiraceae bacterium]|jgi:hypothetical protein|tara:strand:+ start:179 stop:1465 length:1287 start_codon:yes stop_codon:yes gene_type:complete
MKTFIQSSQLLLLFALLISFSSCLEDKCEATRTFVEYEAVFVQPEEFRIDNIEYFESRLLEHPGKIYYYKSTLIINEKYEGIHMYDNSDATSPIYLGFISIPGNLDVSIKDDILYADNYVDLLSIDVSDFKNPKLLDRQEEVFKIYDIWDDQGYFIYTKETERSIEISCDDPNFNNQWFWSGNQIFAEATAAFDVGVPAINNNNSNTGQGGSFARFSVQGEYLYVLNEAELMSYSISNLTEPELLNIVQVDWGSIETLFPYENYLFIGGNAGMFIYDRTNPALPTYVSKFTHARACDPVFVQGNTAYVTLRNGSICESFVNQLDVIDITNVQNPQLKKSYDMTNPHGLAVVNDDLYICDGAAGLRVYDKSDLNEIDKNQVEHIDDINAYDIIPLSKDHIIVVGDGGLYQYDSSNPNSLKELSFISISK